MKLTEEQIMEVLSKYAVDLFANGLRYGYETNTPLLQQIASELIALQGEEKECKCTNCQIVNHVINNGEISVGFCVICGHPLWNPPNQSEPTPECFAEKRNRSIDCVNCDHNPIPSESSKDRVKDSQKTESREEEVTPTAFEWHDYKTGHGYVDYIPRTNMTTEDGYVKIPLYAIQSKKHLTDEEIEETSKEFHKVNGGYHPDFGKGAKWARDFYENK